MKLNFKKITVIIGIFIALGTLLGKMNDGYLYLKAKNFIFKKDPDLLLCIGTMYYKFDNYNVVIGDTLTDYSKNLLIQEYPIRIFNNSEKTIEQIELLILYKEDIYPKYLGQKKNAVLFSRF